MIGSVIKWVLVMFLYACFSYGILTGILLGTKIFIDISWTLILLSPVITCYFAFPIFYVFRKHLPDTFLYFDAESGIYGDPLWRNAEGKSWRLEDKFKTAWAWCVKRNPTWNFWLWFKATRIAPVITYWKGKIEQYDDWRDDLFVPCQIKTDNDNYGQYFNPDKSKLGWLFIVYKDQGKTYWNFSTTYRTKKGKYLGIHLRNLARVQIYYAGRRCIEQGKFSNE